MLKSFDDLLSNKKTVILDGAMGTVLLKQGCPSDACLEKYALNHPDLLKDIYQRYISAGAHIITSATFGANPSRLKKHGLADETANINRHLASLAKKIAFENNILSAGNIGPSGSLADKSNFDDLLEGFRVQTAGLLKGAIDLIIIETMTSLVEAQSAVTAVRVMSDIPILLSFTFNNTLKTSDNFTIADVINEVEPLKINAIGVNCMTDPGITIKALQQLKSLTNLPLLAQPNAGIPSVIGNYPVTPEEFAVFARKIRDLGVTFIGGCCGTDPGYIKAMADGLKK